MICQVQPMWWLHLAFILGESIYPLDFTSPL